MQKSLNKFDEGKSIKDGYIEILEEQLGVANAEELMDNPQRFLEIIKSKQNYWHTVRTTIERYLELDGTQVEIDGEMRNFTEYKFYRTFDAQYSFYMTDFWKSRRQRILKRDDYKCQNCGKTYEQQKEESDNNKGLEVHHIKKRLNFPYEEQGKEGDAHEPSNLITLCQRCHFDLETKSEKEQREILDIQP